LRLDHASQMASLLRVAQAREPTSQAALVKMAMNALRRTQVL
jgi:hypothetical protein